MKLLIPALIAFSCTPALASSSRAIELLASCQSPRYAVVVTKTTRGLVGVVRAADQSATDPDLKSISLDFAADPRFALSYGDRANMPSVFKLGFLQPVPGQPVQALLERAILDNGVVVANEAMTCTYPVVR